MHGTSRQVIGYVRVSTSEQAIEGVSLALQARKIAAYCEVKDWTLIEVFSDEGHSAKSLNRPAMQQLLGVVEAGQVSTIIVYKLDRLTRSVADLDRLVKLFEKKGVALVSLQESLDATTATGRLMMNLLASVSQWEREVIGERTREAMAHKKANREACGSRVPYGWQLSSDGNHLEPHPTEQVIVRKARDYRLQGLSLRGIGRQLTVEGYRPRLGRAWHATCVKALLAAEGA